MKNLSNGCVPKDECLNNINIVRQKHRKSDKNSSHVGHHVSSQIAALFRDMREWGEWPSRLRRCYQNWKVPGSNPARRSAGLRDPTSLRGSR